MVTPWRLLRRSRSLLATTLFHCCGPSKARCVHVQTHATVTADTSCAHDRHAHESLISATYFLTARLSASSLAQLREHPSKIWLRPIRFGPHPLRVHQKVLLAPAVTDTAPSAPQVFHSFQGLFKRHEACITSTLLSVKSTHDGSKYSSRCSSPCAHLPQSCRTFTRRRLLDVERLSHVVKLTAHRLPTSFVRKQKKLRRSRCKSSSTHGNRHFSTSVVSFLSCSRFTSQLQLAT